jgi:hypothetical protein
MAGFSFLAESRNGKGATAMKRDYQKRDGQKRDGQKRSC